MKPSEPSVEFSASMLTLLDNVGLCHSIAVNGEHYREILTQVQLDAVTEDNMNAIGPTILALKKIQETILMFESKGKALIAQEEKKK
jgi:aldehyde:ferredoxin oxidoreductase